MTCPRCRRTTYYRVACDGTMMCAQCARGDALRDQRFAAFAFLMDTDACHPAIRAVDAWIRRDIREELGVRR